MTEKDKLRGHVTALLADWCVEEPCYGAELYRRLVLGERSSKNVAVPTDVRGRVTRAMVSKMLSKLQHDEYLDYVSAVQNGRIMSPKSRYTQEGRFVSGATDFEPFKLYYHPDSVAERMLEEKEELLRRMMIIGDRCWSVAEDVLYESAKSIFGYRDETGAVNVVRAKRGSSAGDVVVRSVSKVFEITVRWECEIGNDYIEAKQDWRNENYPDYDLIIIGTAFEDWVWTHYRHPLVERGEKTDWTRVHKLRDLSGFPLFFDWFPYAPLFDMVRRAYVKVTRKSFAERLVPILYRYVV